MRTDARPGADLVPGGGRPADGPSRRPGSTGSTPPSWPETPSGRAGTGPPGHPLPLAGNGGTPGDEMPQPPGAARGTAGAEIVVITDADVPVFEDPDRPVHPLAVSDRHAPVRLPGAADVTAVRGGGVLRTSGEQRIVGAELRTAPARRRRWTPSATGSTDSSHAAAPRGPTRPTAVMGRPVGRWCGGRRGGGMRGTGCARRTSRGSCLRPAPRLAACCRVPRCAGGEAGGAC